MSAERSFTAYYPGRDFPAASVTGVRCDEMCEHCKAHHLSGMRPIDGPDELLHLAHRIKDANGTGMLVSGGCDIGGTVPLEGCIDAIREASAMGLQINVHAGFIGKAEAEALVSAGVACFSVDIHQDPDIIGGILHLRRDPSEYAELLAVIKAAGGCVMPHVTVGFGRADLILSGELIAKAGLKEVVLLTVMPTPGTMVEESVIGLDGVVAAVDALRGLGLEVTLGCMRDRSINGLEIACIEHGVKSIANPAPATVRWVKENGYTVKTVKTCCGTSQKKSSACLVPSP
jgi:uncharacterized radical SAM superfamily protein